MTLTKEILQEIVERDQREQKARAWLLNGGGGHEDGEDGLRALSLPGAGLVDFLASYEEYLQEQYRAELKEDLLAHVPVYKINPDYPEKDGILIGWVECSCGKAKAEFSREYKYIWVEHLTNGR